MICIYISHKQRFQREKYVFIGKKNMIDSFFSFANQYPWPLPRVRVFQGYKNHYPDPYPYLPYPWPLGVSKPLIIPTLSQAGWVNHLHPHPVSAWTTHTNMYLNMQMKCEHKHEHCPPPYQWWAVHAWYPDSPPLNLTSQCCTAVSIDICTAVARFFSQFWRHTHAQVVHPCSAWKSGPVQLFDAHGC